MSDSFIRLIDIMFAFTMTQGFVIYRNLITNLVLSVDIVALILVYATIVLSWIGYHASVSRYPYNRSAWSRFRLSLDILILVIYAFLVFSIQDLGRVFLGLTAVFLVYVINGVARILEWRDKKVSVPWLSFLYALVFVVEWYVVVFHGNISPYVPWVLSSAAIVILISYRIVRGRLGYPPLIVVGVDLDGVLGEQVPPALERIKAKGKGKRLNKSDIKDWNYKIEDTNISNEIEGFLLDPTFIIEMPVVSGSIAAMEKLYEVYHVVIATNRPKETQQSTINWLKKNFKFHEFANTREVGKDRLGLDILIDDNLDNVRMCASAGGRALLFSQPWNEVTQDKELEDMIRIRRIVRCKDWKDVLNSLSVNKKQKVN